MNSLPDECPRCGGDFVFTLVATDPQENTEVINLTCNECFWWCVACQDFAGHEVHWLIDSSNKHAFIVLGNPPAYNDEGVRGNTGNIGSAGIQSPPSQVACWKCGERRLSELAYAKVGWNEYPAYVCKDCALEDFDLYRGQNIVFGIEENGNS